jgi:hypothetical protein
MTPRKTCRLDLLFLIGVVLLINMPFLVGRCMTVHDTKYVLGIFDYFYGNYLFTGELPRWMAYGLYGNDASVYHVMVMTGPSYLAFFFGKILGITDSLFLFCITHCLEHLLLLLGMYLLSRKLFVERTTVFCVCFTVVSTVMWSEQMFWNFRLYYLFPFAFYFLLRLKEEEKGQFAWLAAMMAVLGPLGSPLYFYPLWGFILTVFSLSLFWGDLRLITRCMSQFTLKNGCAALIFFVFAGLFAGTLWKALDNLTFFSNLRYEYGFVPLLVFLTYGGHDLAELLKELLLPSANINSGIGDYRGMNDYIGMVGIFCLPLALWKLDCSKVRAIAITAFGLFVLSRGGILACAAYFSPGMWLFRHVGYTAALLKLLLLLLAGFGLDLLIKKFKEGSLLKSFGRKIFYMTIVGILLYIDFYLGDAISQAATLRFMPIGLEVASLFPVLRGGFLVVIFLTLWRFRTTSIIPTEAQRKTVLFFLVLCVVVDGILFQVELFSHLDISKTRISFPAQKLNFNPERSDEFWYNMPPKYQVWFGNTPTAMGTTEYQIVASNSLQWDPPILRHRMDWYPKNVWEMQKTMDKTSPDYKAICGIEGPRLRILSQVQYVASNRQAWDLLQAKTGWDRKLILTAPDESMSNLPSSVTSSNPPAPLPTEFSADSISWNIPYSSTQPGWLVYADAYMPGWHARINGTSVPILEAYGAFKAIRLNPGQNHIQLYYDKGMMSVCLSLLAFGTGLAAAGVIIFLFWLALSELLWLKGD